MLKRAVERYKIPLMSMTKKERGETGETRKSNSLKRHSSIFYFIVYVYMYMICVCVCVNMYVCMIYI
jgi:hypothetical protein